MHTHFFKDLLFRPVYHVIGFPDLVALWVIKIEGAQRFLRFISFIALSGC